MSRRALTIALFASLALNLFLVGVAAGVLGARWKPFRPEARPGPPLAAAVATLPPDRREAFRQAGPRRASPELREARRLRREAFQSFAEEPFDAQAALAKLEQARAREQAGRAAVDRRLVAFAATLSPEERARFGEALASPGPRRRHVRSGGGEGRFALPDR